MKAAYQEKELMEKLDHPNIAKCVASFEDKENFVIASQMMNCDLRTFENNVEI